ncbi:uncharacterized protein LOC141904008 [Tubulanus polymorphus]|uniref:uncharacterized protein LOC141904008 n=1 Tax=Tubulanus polymorphus TaxID=672921 RepID=UPI003DA54E0E
MPLDSTNAAIPVSIEQTLPFGEPLDTNYTYTYWTEDKNDSKAAKTEDVLVVCNALANGDFLKLMVKERTIAVRQGTCYGEFVVNVAKKVGIHSEDVKVCLVDEEVELEDVFQFCTMNSKLALLEYQDPSCSISLASTSDTLIIEPTCENNHSTCETLKSTVSTLNSSNAYTIPWHKIAQGITKILAAGTILKPEKTTRSLGEKIF